MFCRNCGAKIPGGGSFCGSCGTPIKEEPVTGGEPQGKRPVMEGQERGEKVKMIKERFQRSPMEDQPKNSVWSIIKILLVMYGMTVICLLMLTVMLGKLGLSEGVVSVGIIVIYILSGFIGGFMGGRTLNGKKFLRGAEMGFCYLLILVIGSAVLHKGINIELSRFVTTLVLCIGSGGIGGMVSKGNKNAGEQ